MIRAERGAGWGRRPRGDPDPRGCGAERSGVVRCGAGRRADSTRRGPARPSPEQRGAAPAPLSPPSLAQLIAPEDFSPNLSAPLLRARRTPRPPPPNFSCRHRYTTFGDFFFFFFLLSEPPVETTKALIMTLRFKERKGGEKS